MQKGFWVYYGILIVVFSVILSTLPGHNGDMPFYITCVIEQETGIKEPFAAAKEVLKVELFEEEYGKHAKRLDGAMPGILDFYRIKPLYIQIVSFIHKLGFPYIFSTLLPSLIAYCFIGLLTFSWATRVLNQLPAMLISITLMLTNAAMILARLSGPDGLSCLVILLCLYNIYFGNNKYLTGILLILSIWLRMDNVVSAFVILTGMKYLPSNNSRAKLNYGEYFGFIALITGTALFINLYFVGDPYWFKKITYITTLREYYLQVMIYVQVFSASFYIGLLIFFALIQYYYPFRIKEMSGFVLLLIIITVVTRFLLFPSLEDRFMTAFYIALTLLIAERFKLAFTAKLKA